MTMADTYMLNIDLSYVSLVIFASLFPLLTLKSVHRNHWFVLWQVQVAISSAQEAFSLLLDFLSFFGRGGRGQIIHFWLISAPRPISAQRFSANAYTRSCAKKNYWSFFEKKREKMELWPSKWPSSPVRKSAMMTRLSYVSEIVIPCRNVQVQM